MSKGRGWTTQLCFLVLLTPSPDWRRPTHTAEGGLLYSVSHANARLFRKPSQTRPEMMFSQLSLPDLPGHLPCCSNQRGVTLALRRLCATPHDGLSASRQSVSDIPPTPQALVGYLSGDGLHSPKSKLYQFATHVLPHNVLIL